MTTKIKFRFISEEAGNRVGQLDAVDYTRAQVAAPGFLDKFLEQQGIKLDPTDLIMCDAKEGISWYKPELNDGSVTLKVVQ